MSTTAFVACSLTSQTQLTPEWIAFSVGLILTCVTISLALNEYDYMLLTLQTMVTDSEF